MNPHLFSVVLAGGSGTRFWPASRRMRPKQLLDIGPGTGSLIEATVRRVEPLCPPERILIATGVHLLDQTREVLDWLPDSSFLGEPVARNTAPCIAWASWVAMQRDPDALVMVLPSDPHIGDEAAFRRALESAVASAATDVITTIGITPTRPETGFGYLEAGAEVSPGVLRVVRFVEKPDRARAEEYVASGRHLWNSGMFFFRARVLLERVQQHLPEVAAGLKRMGRAEPGALASETAKVFEGFPSVSIDHGVMEKSTDLVVVPAAFGWNDLGSWQSAWELDDKDENDNVLPQGAVAVESKGNLVRAGSDRVIALCGVENLCVIETDDALLIMPRERSQDVKKIVEALEARGRRDLL
jgi:mannose-1-phosphate guanylyltransferase